LSKMLAPDESRNIAVRKKLPTRRKGYTQKFKIKGQTVYMSTGEYPDGKLGEIFIDMHKEGAPFRGMLNAFAMSLSIGLQHGVPLEEYIDAYLLFKFEPSGDVTGHKNISFCNSVIDCIVRDLGINYLNRGDLATVKEKDDLDV